MRRPSGGPSVADPKIARATHALQANQTDEAICLLEKVLQKKKRDPQAWFLLSTAYGQAGNMQEVIRCAQKVLKVLPDHVGSLTNLGNAYAATDQQEKAARCYEKALKQAPNDPRLLNNAGCALILAGKRKEAAIYFKRVLAITPNHSHAHAGLAEILTMEGKIEEAIYHNTEALRLQPDLFKAHKGLGLLCRAVGDIVAAEKHYEAAVRLSDADSDVITGYAATLSELGRREQAMRLLDEAMVRSPYDFKLLGSKAYILEQQGEVDEAFRLVSQIDEAGEHNPDSVNVFTRVCQQFQCCDQALDIVNELLTHDLEAIHLQSLSYAAGTLLDKLGRYDEAFSFFRKASEAVPLSFDHDSHQKYVSSLMDTFSSEKMSALPRAGNADRRPIFIVGMPRSGTTLTEQILSSHPDVYGAGELGFIESLIDRIKDADGNHYPVALAGLSPEDLDKLAAAYLHSIGALAPGSPKITDKLPQNFLHLGLIRLFFPKAAIIHCRRNPLDTCLSIYFQSFLRPHDYAADLENIGLYYLQYHRLMAHWKEVLDIPILDVQYEEMVASQEKWTRRILVHCSLEWHDACLNFHETKRVVATASYGQLREEMCSSSVERWRNYERHIDTLKNTLAPLLVEDDR